MNKCPQRQEGLRAIGCVTIHMGAEGSTPTCVSTSYPSYPPARAFMRLFLRSKIYSIVKSERSCPNTSLNLRISWKPQTQLGLCFYSRLTLHLTWGGWWNGNKWDFFLEPDQGWLYTVRPREMSLLPSSKGSSSLPRMCHNVGQFAPRVRQAITWLQGKVCRTRLSSPRGNEGIGLLW